MFKHISVVAKPVPLSKLLDENFSGEIFREEKIARAAPNMLAALKEARRALSFSRPVGTITPEIEARHKAAHQACCDVLMELGELHPIDD